MTEQDRPVESHGVRWYARPEVAGFSVVFVVLGIVLGLFVLPEQWSLAGRLGAGLSMAAAASLSFFANRSEPSPASIARS